MAIKVNGTTVIQDSPRAITNLETALSVGQGGTGRASGTAYAVVCGGTTTTGALQSVGSVGTSGQVLTSNGASALPTFQTLSSSGVTSFSAGTTGFTPSTATTGAVSLAGTLAITNGGTGGTTAATARSNLGVAATGSDTTYAFRSNNLSDLGSPTTARSNLGLGSLATASSVSLTTQVTGTLPVGNGGTGSTTLAGAGICTLSGTQTLSGTKTFSSIIAASYNYTTTTSNYFNAPDSSIKMDIAGTNRFSMSATVTAFNMSDVQKVGGGTFNTISDRRYKQDITAYEKGLTELKQLSLVNYRYTPEFMKSDVPSKQFVGLIAQDVQNTGFSNCVASDDNGYLALDTSQLTYALINAVKELSSKVETLEAEINLLKQQ